MSKRYIGINLSPKRIETLNDGVLVIVMTLLVLNLTIPELKESETEKLSQELLEMFPKFYAYILSFVVLGIFWVIHHYQFHYIRRPDGVLLWINLAFLMSVALIPFTTSLVGEYHQEKVAVILYEINLVISLFLLYAIWAYATGSHRLVDSDIEQRDLAQMNKIIITGIFFILIGIAFYDPFLSLNPLTPFGVFYIIFTTLGGHGLAARAKEHREKRRKEKWEDELQP